MDHTDEPRRVHLESFEWQWDEGDKDANFKKEVAIHSLVDPLPTIDTMSRNLNIPVGAIVRYILVKWASSGSDGLLEIGPRVVRQMAEVIENAEAVGTDEERLNAYRKLGRIISWLSVPLTKENVDRIEKSLA